MEELTWRIILAKALFKYSSFESQADVLVLPVQVSSMERSTPSECQP